MAKRDDEAAARSESDELDARIDARIHRALNDFRVERGMMHPADRDAALAADAPKADAPKADDLKKDGE